MATGNYLDQNLQEDTDQESGEDSDNVIGRWEGGTLQQKRLIKRRGIGLPSDSCEDEFEREMASALDDQMEAKYPFSQYSSSRKGQEAQKDALFYDPNMDDEDEKWVKEQRRAYQTPSATSVTETGASGQDSKQHKTDVVLNCPACMCTVCLNCQRHSIYDQYRAIFTLNTVVNYGETLQYKKKFTPKNKRKRKLGDDTMPVNSQSSGFSDLVNVDPATAAEEMDIYHPVNCANCKTRLAVYDADEVYHFFNVISSYG